MELPYNPAISLLGTYPEKNMVRKDTCSPVFIAAVFIIARTCKDMVNSPQIPGLEGRRVEGRWDGHFPVSLRGSSL